MLIELGDIQLTSKNVTAALFALCYLTNTNPKAMAEKLIKGLPGEREWQEEILPSILDYPEDYQHLTWEE